jgi:hypothetical protein
VPSTKSPQIVKLIQVNHAWSLLCKTTGKVGCRVQKSGVPGTRIEQVIQVSFQVITSTSPCGNCGNFSAIIKKTQRGFGLTQRNQIAKSRAENATKKKRFSTAKVSR